MLDRVCEGKGKKERSERMRIFFVGRGGVCFRFFGVFVGCRLEVSLLVSGKEIYIDSLGLVLYIGVNFKNIE